MALTNYGELKTAVQDWMFDADDIGTNAADIVTLAQGYLNRKLRCRDMITQATLTISSELYALPSDYLQYRSVTELASIRRRLEYIPYEEAEVLYASRPSGLGTHFTIIGSNIRVYPTPGNNIELTYYARLGAFASDAATDWLLTKFPNLYLSASLMFAAEFIKDDGEVQKYAGITDGFIDMLRSEDEVSQFAGAQLYPNVQVW